jgi:hypothetical protein
VTALELRNLFRSEMKDAVEPYLWSDPEVYTYLDDAQKMFCRLTNGIADATTAAVVDIDVEEGDTWLDLHASILKIRGATRTSDGAELAVLNYEDLAPRGIRFVAGTTERLSTLIVGMEENKLRLMAEASEDDAVKLLVFRLPINTLAKGVALEIPEQHHYHLLPWAKRCALLKQDAETFDKSKAQEMEMTFRAYCADAKTEQNTKRHKIRTVAYGGI